jgi:hypothetical protein
MSSRIGLRMMWRAAMGGVMLSATLLLTTCTGALLEPLPVQTSTLDDRLELTGHVCTLPPNPDEFPVKVVFIVDESGSMCISDPPGSQQAVGFCEMPAVVAAETAEGITNASKPGRVRAIEQLITQFQAESNVSIAILPFETSPMQQWPAAGGFAPPDDTATQFCDALATELGNGTDTQGVLIAAQNLISADIAQTAKSHPELLPRSRYEVVFLTDGTPFPHCTAAVNLPPQDYATPEQPWLIWEDDSTYCTQGPPPTDPAGNPIDPGKCGSEVVCVNGQPFQPGTDINQNYQIFDAVKQIMALKSEFNVGDVRIDTVLLLNQQAVQICGSLCTDVYGIWPGLNPATYPEETFKAASWLLQQIAALGNGTFQAFTNNQIQTLSLAGLDYASLASPIVMKNLFVQSLTSVPTPTGRIFDSDGDGLPDTIDNSFTIGTSAFDADTVSDCIGDQFKYLHEDEGFNPVCSSALASPMNGGCYVSGTCEGNAGNGCICSDGDGDGLPDDVEAILGTSDILADSSGDGIPDPLKARYGFNPTVWQLWQHQDTDGDGISDWDEFRANTDPTTPDADLYATDGYQYQITGTPQADGSTCYDFTVSNLKLLQTPSHSGAVDGYNLFKVWFDEAPASSIATDYGYWRAACAWSQYSPPSVRVPAGPSLSLNPAGSNPNAGLFVELQDFGPPFQLPTATCAGTGP